MSTVSLPALRCRSWPPTRMLPRGVFDLAAKTRRLAELEQAATKPDFWDDAHAAAATQRQAETLRVELGEWQQLLAQADDLVELSGLAELGDTILIGELEHEREQLAARLDRLRQGLFFGEPYDEHDAIITINAGAGGTEAADWAAMLMRMYLRWGERHGLKAEIIERVADDESGIKNATFSLSGRRAYGWLKVEMGVHRLVRISPFDSQGRRHTSFARVEVLPDVGETPELGEIPPDELHIETFRAQGAGGQNMQKTDSAVRITHLPTGISAQSQNERSQRQNRELALAVLRARLLAHRLRERERELARFRGEQVEAGWGRQIRSYTLAPFQLVKDHRNGHESGSASAILDGDIDAFLLAEIEHAHQPAAPPASTA